MKNKKIQEFVVKKGLGSRVPLVHGVGRRKSSRARVWIRHGNGKILVNTKDSFSYFDTDVANRFVVEAIALTETSNIFDIEANVKGGGKHSQAEAVRLGISRALSAYDERYRKILRESGLLTVDSRLKERKKYGQRGARRKFQFVKR